MPSVLIAAIAITMPFSGVADVRPAGLFADNMVIHQRRI
jgi:hypothetical protein